MSRPSLTLKIKASPDGRLVTCKGGFLNVDMSKDVGDQPDDVKTLVSLNVAFLEFLKKLNEGD